MSGTRSDTWPRSPWRPRVGSERDRLREQPAVSEGVDDGGVAAVLVVGRRAVEGRALLHRPGHDGVDAGHLQVEGDGRARAGTGGGVADVGELVGQHHQGAAEVELGVADASVGHHDGLAPEAGAEGVGVPLDRLAAVGDGEVGGERHPGDGRAAVGGGGGVVGFESGDGHVDSFGEGEGVLEAGPEAGLEGGIGTGGHDGRAEGGEGIGHHSTIPSVYARRKADRARTRRASVACRVRPMRTATSGTGRSSR